MTPWSYERITVYGASSIKKGPPTLLLRSGKQHSRYFSPILSSQRKRSKVMYIIFT